jgi:hypothetical protein
MEMETKRNGRNKNIVTEMENSFDKFHQQTVHNMGKSKE